MSFVDPTVLRLPGLQHTGVAQNAIVLSDVDGDGMIEV